MTAPGYDPRPTYPPVGGDVVAGWEEPVSELVERADGALVLAVDGPAVLDWADALVAERGTDRQDRRDSVAILSR